MKKILSTLSLLALGGTLALGVHSVSKKAQPVAAESVVKSYQTYIPVRQGWIENTDGSAETKLGDAVRGRHDRFWNGNSDPNNWDSQERSFNAMDEFVDTIHRANGGEGWRGAYRTPELTLVDNDHRYISFLFGGGEGDIFVNVWHVRYANGSESFPDGYNRNVIEGLHTFFDGSGTFDDKNAKYNAPRTCNMTFRYYRLPDSIQPGDQFLIYVRDGKTGGYGGFTFGSVNVNQTLEECAKKFSAHKQQMKLNEYMSDWTKNANESVLNFYANDPYYADIRTAEEALTDADEGFEFDNGTRPQLNNWAFDQDFSSADVDFTTIVSDNDAKNWQEKMPANKSGTGYINADVSGIGEGERYRLVSNEFTLSGTGFISAKLGGGTAVMSLIDSTGAELISSRVAAAEGENILNGAFIDNNVANVMSSGARLNTMSRTYLDGSAHVGKKVRVTLSDERTGGNWGLAYFDEVVTRYDSIPTLKVDKIEQQWNDTPLYHGVVTDKYFGDKTTTFGKAYDFVQSFYGAVRNPESGQSWCEVKNSESVEDVVIAYNLLEPEVKALVDAAQDFDFGLSKTSENWYLTEANFSCTVGETMTAIRTGVYPGAIANAQYAFNNNKSINFALIAVVCASSISILLLILLKKRRKIESK